MSEEIRAGERWTENQTRELLEELLEVLAFVHGKNIIHRDIKPANIMRRNSDGKLVLVDFGCIKEVATGKTNTVIIQSRGYTASEQTSGRPKFASDVYSVGIIGIQVLTGLDPKTLTRDDQEEIIWRQHAQVSSHFGDVLAKMVKDHVSNRYFNANEAFRALSVPSSSPQIPQTPPSSSPTLPSPSPNISLAQTLTGHSNNVRSVAISADNRTIVSGSRDGTIKVWKVSP